LKGKKLLSLERYALRDISSRTMKKKKTSCICGGRRFKRKETPQQQEDPEGNLGANTKEKRRKRSWTGKRKKHVPEGGGAFPREKRGPRT